MFKYLFFALRPQHWVKNFFVLMPLLFGKKLFVYPENQKVLEAMIAFCLMSSAVYLLNDILNLNEDKNHRTKQLRPIASGKVSKTAAVSASMLLCGVSLIFSWYISPALTGILSLYFILNLFYSYFLRNIVIIDVFCVSFFFFLRIAAGTVVADVVFSHWMLFMIVLLAMFLAFQKRRQEILSAGNQLDKARPVLLKYNIYFIDQMINVLTSSMVVVYMLYTIDDRTVAQFGTNHLFYSIPFVYYGIFRYLYLVHKRRQAEDPTQVLLSDFMTQINIAAWVAVCTAVIYFHL